MPAPAVVSVVESSTTAVGMCAFGAATAAIGLWSARRPVAEARGLEKVVALGHVSFAVPLAVFGALHLFGPQFVKDLVPRYMPGRMFWVYLVGVALVAASLSIATRIQVRWSGLLFGAMMFLFVAMIHFPGALRTPHNRIIWTIVFRESSFGGAAWLLAATAEAGWRGRTQTVLLVVGRFAITAALLVFGVMHFRHPTGLPGVPLVKQMPEWLTGRQAIDYLTGAALLACAGSAALNWRVRTVAAAVGGWLLLLVLVIYGPVLVSALAQPGLGTRIEGINYFADTLLFAGVVLALARTAPPADG